MNVRTKKAMITLACLCWMAMENDVLGFPAAANDASRSSLGKSLYESRCAPCHGLS